MAATSYTDAGLRSALLGLGALVALVGCCTWSLNKALVTYAFGVAAIAGIALPDWELFDMSVQHWTTPLPCAPRRDSEPLAYAPWFRMYPLRIAFYLVVYGFGFNCWWKCMIY